MPTTPPQHFDLIDPPPTPPPPAGSAARHSDYDAIADLFLGDDAPAPRASTTHRPALTTPPSTELLIAGHLPVLTGAWVVQYASRLARDSGSPIALAQIAPDRTAIQVLWPTEPERRPDPAHDLRAAVHRANQIGVRWLIATDELSMLPLLADERIASACLLTSPNEAATVAAYQSLKSIATELSRVSRADTVALRVAFAGASPEDAERAREKLDRAAGVFIHRRIELAAAVNKIAPTSASVLYDTDRRTPAPRLLDLIAETPPPTPPVSRPRTEAHRPTPAAASTPMASPGTAHQEPRLRTPAPTNHRTLCAHIKDTTLRVTPMRCPDAPDTEIAIDEAGVIHVLRDATTITFDAAAREIWSVTGWLTRQASLVNMALARDADTPIRTETHLFVPHARDARSLLDAPVRLHLKRTERVGAHEITFCEPLN